MYRLETIGLYGRDMPTVETYQTYVEDMHALGYKGQGITVAVVDSGVDLTDPKTKAVVIGGMNYVPGEDPANLQDKLGHGALVAKIILTIAPEAKLWVGRVFGDVGSAENPVVAAGLKTGAVNADLTNASLGGPDDPSLAEAVAEYERLAKPLVAAAGNEGDGLADTLEWAYPAAHPYATSVGAVDRGIVDPTFVPLPLRPARYSNSNETVDCVAIGRIPGSWDQGTSFAAPVVAGLLAVYKSWAIATGRGHDDPACYGWLINNCRQIPGFLARNDQTGYGMATLRPHQISQLLEIDVRTLECYLNGQVIDPKPMGLANKAPGGIYGWFRPFCDLLKIRVGYDDWTKRASYRN